MRTESNGKMKLTEGQQVAVDWGKLGWLPGVFVKYTSGEYGEDFDRCMVKMDNGFACDAPGYHPDCVIQPTAVTF